MRTVVMGASGALGQAFVQAHVACNHQVYALSRHASACSDVAMTHAVDYADADSIAKAAQAIAAEGPLDRVVVATGLLHDARLQPEKNIQAFEGDHFHQLYHINTVGPALMMQAFLPLLRTDAPAIFAVLSARVGSIDDNRAGGWYAYRMAKCALNMLVKCASIEVARRHKQQVVIGLHPGTVKSALSDPFTSRIEPERLFTPEHSVAQLMAVLDGVTPEHSGQCLAYDGQVILP